MQIPVARPVIGQDEVAAVSDVLMSDMTAPGEKVAGFEQKFAGYCGAAHAALLAAGVGFGDEVVVPAFSFIATATAVSMCGAKPVFADVDEQTFTILPDQVRERITPKTKAVIGVHLFGQLFDVDPILEICETHTIPVIEDAAQAHGALYHGVKTGNLGKFGCFSFSAANNMITGEGGMVTTNDKPSADRLRRIVNPDKNDESLCTEIGYNYRMTDIAAAIGIVQLRKLDKFNLRRRKNAEYYAANLTATGIVRPKVADNVQHVYNQYVIQVTKEFPLSRGALMDLLKAKGIGSAVHYPIPLHRQPLYGPVADPDPCPVASRLSETVLSLPVHPSLDTKDLAYICEVINKVK
ncbi:MAG: DegT/DnrJ/EryC1/StrS family aminotransferase [Methanoregula sp.]